MSEKPYYETMYILRPDIPEEEVESHLKKYSEMLVESGTEVLDSQMRGKRRLAYPIAKHKEGIYVQLSHKGNGQQVASLERAMRLSEDVIRYLTVKQDGPLPTPKSSSKDEDEKSKTDDKKDIKTTENNTESPGKEDEQKDSKD
tara:strand:+ start:88 stop:519 length:432 start_codon:yes stop_codon:yes gene_type:complete